MRPEEALALGAQILIEHFNIITNLSDISDMTVRLPSSDESAHYTSKFDKGLNVKSGKVQITKLTNERATVRINKFVVQLGETTLNIDGMGSCEIK